MKYLIFVFMFISSPLLAGEICREVDSKIDPNFRWKESDFTKEASSKALSELSESINKNEMLATFQLPNNLTLIEGYILKQDALRALDGKSVHTGMVDYYVTNFCEFLIRTPIYD